MLPPQKIITFDLDGTITASKSPVTEDMANLVKELVKRAQVIIISGGKFGQFQTQLLSPYFDQDFLKNYSKNLTLMPTSGSQQYEYDTEKGEWLMTNKVSLGENVKEKIKKLLADIITSGQYDIPPNPRGPIVEDRDTQITFSGLGQLAPVAEKTLWDPDKKKREKITAALLPHLPEVSMLINAHSSIDFLPKGFNKAVALNSYLKKLGLAKDDIIYVGDGIFPGGNDYSAHEAGFKTVPVKGPEETAAVIAEWIG